MNRLVHLRIASLDIRPTSMVTRDTWHAARALSLGDYRNRGLLLENKSITSISVTAATD